MITISSSRDSYSQTAITKGMEAVSGEVRFLFGENGAVKTLQDDCGA